VRAAARPWGFWLLTRCPGSEGGRAGAHGPRIELDGPSSQPAANRAVGHQGQGATPRRPSGRCGFARGAACASLRSSRALPGGPRTRSFACCSTRPRSCRTGSASRRSRPRGASTSADGRGPHGWNRSWTCLGFPSGPRSQPRGDRAPRLACGALIGTHLRRRPLGRRVGVCVPPCLVRPCFRPRIDLTGYLHKPESHIVNMRGNGPVAAADSRQTPMTWGVAAPAMPVRLSSTAASRQGLVWTVTSFKRCRAGLRERALAS